jgi:hypothetical protein
VICVTLTGLQYVQVFGHTLFLSMSVSVFWNKINI